MNRLEAIEEIKQLKARYFRCLDAKNWTGLAACLTNDVTFDYPPQQIHVSGSDALVANFSKRHASTKTAHTGSMPEIVMKDTHHAEGIWFMNDVVVGSDDNGTPTIAQGFGHYFESYVHENGQWKIKSILLERLLMLKPEQSIFTIQ